MSTRKRNRFAPPSLCGIRFPYETKRAMRVGTVFGRLTVLGRPFYVRRAAASLPSVVCRCECGTVICIETKTLRGGRVLSCGCYLRQRQSEARRVHGKSETRLFSIWSGMKYRCQQRSTRAHRNYGLRGIAVCKKWDTFIPFMEWALAHGYQDNLTIDRINNDGDYEPGNCRWISSSQQASNRRNNLRIEAFGEKKILSEWAKDARCSVSMSAIQVRLKRGLPPEVAISMPDARFK